MKGRHQLVAQLMAAMAGILGRQATLRPRSEWQPPTDGPASSRKHNRGGVRANQRAALKRRNVLHNRRAHRG